MGQKVRKITKVEVQEEDEQSSKDVAYWLSKTPSERMAEVTRLIQKDLKPGQRMVKTKVNKIQLHEKL